MGALQIFRVEKQVRAGNDDGSFPAVPIPASEPSQLTRGIQRVQIAKGYVIDLLIEDSLIVEIKSVDKLLPLHAAQLMTYLRLQRRSAGLLINFNVHTLITRYTVSDESWADPAVRATSVCSVSPW
jgi:hypothetical protein